MSTEFIDDTEEVVDMESMAATEEGQPTEPEDRGDVVSPELSTENLKELVADESKDAPATESHKTASIPKARFDEVNEAKKEYQRQLEEANQIIAKLTAPQQQQAQEPQPQFDEDAKEQAYIEAMLDGDTATAKQIRREINANLRQQAVLDVETQYSQRQSMQALKDESAAAIESFPYLDTPEGSIALKLIITARDADIAKGVAPHLALRDAVNLIAPRFQTSESEAPEAKVLQNEKSVDTRSVNAVRRGANDSLRQPPSIQSGIGNRTTAGRVDVANMDDEQFASLSEAELKRLRGD